MKLKQIIPSILGALLLVLTSTAFAGGTVPDRISGHIIELESELKLTCVSSNDQVYRLWILKKGILMKHNGELTQYFQPQMELETRVFSANSAAQWFRVYGAPLELGAPAITIRLSNLIDENSNLIRFADLSGNTEASFIGFVGVECSVDLKR
jgi:hypothetical protein